MRAWLYSGLLGSTLLCVACVNSSDFEIDSITLNPTLDLPLAHGNLQIIDILNDEDSTHFQTDEDGLLYIAYDDELVSEDVRGLFDIPNLEVARSFVLPGMVVPPHNQDITHDQIQSVVEFPLDPEKLSEIALKNGNIHYLVELSPQSTNLDYEVVLVLDDYRSRTTGETLNTVIEDEGDIDISDYTITLNENKFNLKLQLIFKATNSQTTIAPATSVNVTLQFQDLDFDYIRGFFGDQVTSMEPREVAIDFFDDGVFKNANVSFAEPRVNLTVFNENGVPCTVDFLKMEARKEGADPINITLNPANPVPLEYPSVMGESEITRLNVVNVKDLMDYAPSSIFYESDVRINQGHASGNNFMIDSSAMKVKLRIEVPLWGSASGVVLQDTLAVDLESMEASQVVSAKLQINLVNQIPLGGNVQFILTDAEFTPLGTLLTDEQTNLIQPSVVDANGDLQAAGEFDGLIDLDQSRIEEVFKAKYLILVANMETSRNASGPVPNVKFKADYGLSIKTKVIATLKMAIE